MRLVKRPASLLKTNRYNISRLSILVEDHLLLIISLYKIVQGHVLVAIAGLGVALGGPGMPA